MASTMNSLRLAIPVFYLVFVAVPSNAACDSGIDGNCRPNGKCADYGEKPIAGATCSTTGLECCAECPNKKYFNTKHVCPRTRCFDAKTVLDFCNTERPKDELLTQYATVFIDLTDKDFTGILYEDDTNNKFVSACKSEVWVETWYCYRTALDMNQHKPWTSAKKSPNEINSQITDDAKWISGTCDGIHATKNGHFFQKSRNCCPNTNFNTRNVCESCDTTTSAATYSDIWAAKDQKINYVIKKKNIEITYSHGTFTTTNGLTLDTCDMEDYALTYKCEKKKGMPNYTCEKARMCKIRSSSTNGGLTFGTGITNPECK